jgi:hypothetical protein
LIPYLPAEIVIAQSNFNIESWKFSDQKLNPKFNGKGIMPNVFQFEEPKGEGWTIRRAPTMPVAPYPRPKK